MQPPAQETSSGSTSQQRRQNAPIIGQRYACLSPNSANRKRQNHTPFLADFIITTSGSKFSVHTHPAGVLQRSGAPKQARRARNPVLSRKISHQLPCAKAGNPYHGSINTPFGSDRVYLAISPAVVSQISPRCLTICSSAWRNLRARCGCPITKV